MWNTSPYNPKSQHNRDLKNISFLVSFQKGDKDTILHMILLYLNQILVFLVAVVQYLSYPVCMRILPLTAVVITDA